MANDRDQKPIDDSEHKVLYISPGDTPYTGGRTYGWKPARNADEEADLRSAGYVDTLPEAFKATDKPLANRELAADLRPDRARAKDAKRAPAAPAAPAKSPAPELETDPISGDPITGDDGDPATPALADVQAALGKLKGAKDAKAVTKLLKQFDATSATKLDEAKYAEVIAAADKAAKE